jgi:hypothetical protein
MSDDFLEQAEERQLKKATIVSRMEQLKNGARTPHAKASKTGPSTAKHGPRSRRL